MSVEANTDGVATADQREQFERDGYLVIDEAAAEETLDAIVAELDGMFGQPPYEEGGVRFFRNRIQDAWKIKAHIKELALSPPVHALLQDLYGRRPLPFQTINFRRGTQQAPHSDAIHFSTMPEGFMCGVWVALEDMDMDNGPLFYHPGSQRLPEVTMQDVGVEADHSQYLHYEEYMQSVVKDLPIEYGLINKGQALIWSANLLHGGSPAKDPNRTRKSQVTHFFFEGTRYYTPLLSKDLSSEEGIFWREPEWIPT